MLTTEILKSEFLKEARKIKGLENKEEFSDEVLWDYVHNYFKFFSERVKTLDKLHFNFMGIGTIQGSLYKIDQVLAKRKNIAENFDTLSDFKKVMHKNSIERWQKDQKELEAYRELAYRVKQNGVSVRKLKYREERKAKGLNY